MSIHDEHRRHQLDEILQHVLDLPVDKRITYIISATSDDPTLIDDVKKLLDYHDESEEVLGDSISDFLSPLLPILEGNKPESHLELEKGTLIGNYRIEKLLGKGGMGQVYLAERFDGSFTKKAAIKCIKRGMDSEEIIKRFRYEREILASLQHANIAQLFDGGLTDDGRPYLVMEYVEGKPIDRYCDEKKLTVNDRLRLFLAVCEAVQYAHQKLVVHRDLKPSNIMVTNSGQVKLLDFGIARILDEKNVHYTIPQTRAGIRLLTPEYAAPEQLRDQQISTSTDVYTLGVLLFQILTGHLPNNNENKNQVIGRPSNSVKKSVSKKEGNGPVTFTSGELAAFRATSPEKLERKLRGDLDTIVLKLLKEDPAERYSSAEMLASDIRNYLEDLPLAARPDSPGYRLRKFIQRHRIGVAAAAMFVVVLFLFTLSVSIQQARTSEALQSAEFERAAAEEVAAFLESLFSAANPLAPEPERVDTLSVRELLNRGTERVLDEFTDRPVIRARMLVVIGRSFHSLGDPEHAITLLENALAIYRSLEGDHREDIAKNLNILANTYMDIGNNPHAEFLHREALALRREIHSGNHSTVASSLANVGSALQNQTKFDEAQSFYTEALAMISHLPEPDSMAISDLLNASAALAYRQNDLETAILLTEESLVINRTKLGNEHPRVGRELNNLAFLLDRNNNLEQALPLYREALAINRKLLGEEHPFVGTGMGNLADLLARSGNTSEAVLLFEQAINLQRNRPGGDNPDLSVMLGNYASLLNKTGKFGEAEKLYSEALEIDHRLFGEEHLRVAIIRSRLGVIFCQTGRQAEGQRFVQQAIDVMEQLLPSGHPRLADAQKGLETCAA